MAEPVLDYEALRPGQPYPAIPCCLEPGQVAQYLQATAEHHPLYAQGYVPPLFPSMVRWVKASLGGRWPSGTLHLAQHLELRRPLHGGEALRLGVTVGDKEVRHGRRYVQLHATAWDAKAQPVVQSRMHLLWAGATQEAAPRPAAFPGDTAEPEGRPLPRLAATFTRAMVEAYAEIAAARDPLHLDPDYARHTRFGANVVQGLLLLTLPARLLVQAFGLRWLASGTLSARFRQPVFVGEQATVQGVETRPGHCLLWCTNARGERVLSAEALLG
ncbi:MAG: hypothetical protein KatS3mg131_0548 [Candidatus Tectimicrobiota bacterium]|nr:MAG: hypothetical protein KatS3mg131_0548 [Candidatus Tectomicrobia bacterium]